MPIRPFLLAPAVFVLFIAAAQPAHSALITRGNGLIYDSDLNITWLEDANLAATYTFGVNAISPDGRMDWFTANAWVAAMNEIHFKGFNDWRLPKVSPLNLSYFNYTNSFDGSGDLGINIGAPGSAYPGSKVSELAYMYYNNLSLLAEYTPNGVFNPLFGIFKDGTTGGQASFDIVQNLQSDTYWFGVAHEYDPSSAWIFHTTFGGQGHYNKYFRYHAWAVRDGDVLSSVPEPSSFALALGGLAILGFFFRVLDWRAIGLRPLDVI